MLKIINALVICLIIFAVQTQAQKTSTAQPEKTPVTKKANRRPAAQSSKVVVSEPFDKSTVEAMREKCVRLETEAGAVELELFPESAPESARSFLNLAATGFFDTTAFSRVVPGFVVQGGNLSSRAKMTEAQIKRSRRQLPDEPSLIRHERGIVSMARSEEPNSATTHFFILVGDAKHLDGKFAAFGRVTKGMETVDAINKMPVEGDKPIKPVRLTRATIVGCAAKIEP